MCQTSLGLAQEAQLIGLWSPAFMLILLEAVSVCVCVCAPLVYVGGQLVKTEMEQ